MHLCSEENVMPSSTSTILLLRGVSLVSFAWDCPGGLGLAARLGRADLMALLFVVISCVFLSLSHMVNGVPGQVCKVPGS